MIKHIFITLLLSITYITLFCMDNDLKQKVVKKEIVIQLVQKKLEELQPNNKIETPSIYDMKPITFAYEDEKDRMQYGLIPEEFEFDSNGKIRTYTSILSETEMERRYQEGIQRYGSVEAYEKALIDQIKKNNNCL